ncbi:cyanate permease [Rhodococcus sp. 27YEA15]|uniref:hypothetical protein n=1 Tax=Rhodococcus sp. 27YEA15 TaxID=3156259 RepID=UPI003C7E7E7C
MRKLTTAPIAVFIVITGFAATMLAQNFTPTRAVVWGIGWAITGIAIVRHELKRTDIGTNR